MDKTKGPALKSNFNGGPNADARRSRQRRRLIELGIEIRFHLGAAVSRAIHEVAPAVAKRMPQIRSALGREQQREGAADERAEADAAEQPGPKPILALGSERLEDVPPGDHSLSSFAIVHLVTSAGRAVRRGNPRRARTAASRPGARARIPRCA